MSLRTVEPPPEPTLAALYEDDETGWLEQMAQLIGERRFDELDYHHLQEYLVDMARRDRREVLTRLTSLIAHLLKWEFQPEGRSRSWQLTIAEQRRELGELLEAGTLLNHAQSVLEKAYRHAVDDAVIETGLPKATFLATHSRTVDEWLAREDS